MNKSEEIEFVITIERKPIPFSNAEKTIISITAGHLDGEFIEEVGKLIEKHNKINKKVYYPMESNQVLPISGYKLEEKSFLNNL